MEHGFSALPQENESDPQQGKEEAGNPEGESSTENQTDETPTETTDTAAGEQEDAQPDLSAGEVA